jgi:hypothetical protein
MRLPSRGSVGNDFPQKNSSALPRALPWAISCRPFGPPEGSLVLSPEGAAWNSPGQRPGWRLERPTFPFRVAITNAPTPALSAGNQGCNPILMLLFRCPLNRRCFFLLSCFPHLDSPSLASNTGVKYRAGWPSHRGVSARRRTRQPLLEACAVSSNPATGTLTHERPALPPPATIG